MAIRFRESAKVSAQNWNRENEKKRKEEKEGYGFPTFGLVFSLSLSLFLAFSPSFLLYLGI